MVVRIFLLLWIVLCSVHASVNLISSQLEYKDFDIEYYYIEDKSLDINEVIHVDFTQQIDNRFALGYLNGEHWFKFTINNKSNKSQYVLKFNEVLFKEFDFYEYTRFGWEKHAGSYMTSLEDRSVYSVYPTFILNIPVNESRTFYVRAKSSFSNLGRFDIFEYEYFFSHLDMKQHLYFTYFGMLMMLIIFNIFLFFRFKDRIYIYYVGYTLCFFTFVLIFSGYIFYFNINEWHEELHASAPLFILFLLLFSNRFLNISNLLKKTYRVLQGFVVILLVLAVLIMVDINPWYQVLNVFATFTFILLIYAAVRTMMLGNRRSIYYLFAILVYMFTIIFMSSMANGWIEYTYFNRYAYLYGALFELIFFALMLVNRFYVAQSEKITIQKELIRVKSKNEAYLKQEVEIRTREINEMNTMLQSMVKDKELLLKELYHRVKNNFQMVSSLLWIELSKIEGDEIKERLNNILGRLKSMSIMHDFLYNTDKVSDIQSNEYILKVIAEVKKIYMESNITIDTKLTNVDIDMNDAMNLGMIINEVLNNSIKHHPNVNECEITLSFTKEGDKYLLSIKDNGLGFEYKSSDGGLGMGLIQQFVNKLEQSKYEFIKDNGTLFKLSFGEG